jgi:hypothetical protein
MEIPTEEIIQKIQASINFDTKLTEGNRNEAIRTIKDQAREILDLQTTICRLKVEIQQKYDDYRISSDLREAGIRTGE